MIINYDEKIVPIHKNILVYDMYFGEQVTKSGIVIMDDDGKDSGIHPRWAKVYSVGPENVDVIPDQWILISHGRWSRGIKVYIKDENGNIPKSITIRKIDPNDILLVTDENPEAKKVGLVGPICAAV